MSKKMDALIVGRDRCLMITPVSGIQNEGASRLTLEALISSLNISARNKKTPESLSWTFEMYFYSNFWQTFQSVEKISLFKGFRLLLKSTETP